MSVAERVIWEMYGAVAAPPAKVVPLAVKMAHPKECLRRTQRRMKRLGRGRLDAQEASGIVAACNACRACMTPQ